MFNQFWWKLLLAAINIQLHGEKHLTVEHGGRSDAQQKLCHLVEGWQQHRFPLDQTTRTTGRWSRFKTCLLLTIAQAGPCKPTPALQITSRKRLQVDHDTWPLRAASSDRSLLSRRLLVTTLSLCVEGASWPQRDSTDKIDFFCSLTGHNGGLLCWSPECFSWWCLREAKDDETQAGGVMKRQPIIRTDSWMFSFGMLSLWLAEMCLEWSYR